MELRAATAEDFSAIVRLVPNRDELFLVYPRGSYPFSVKQLRELVAGRKALTVAVQDGKVVGFANLYGVEARRCAYVGNVIVKSSLRGAGIGRQLVRHMVELAFRRYRLTEVRISVFNTNTAALLLYSDLGFKPYAAEARQNHDGKRVALLHLRITRDEHRARRKTQR